MSKDAERVELDSPDLAKANREALCHLFPGVIDDGVLDAERLSSLLDLPLSSEPADGRERYGLQWAGKKVAIRSLLTPGSGALVPDLDASVDFDSAKNVFIEGDNLEVLVLLQKAYNDRIKLIYVDPPYNTGNDFVYNDSFSDRLSGYLEYTGQADKHGKLISSNVETSGRRHSKWLSMMYTRLVLARNLLSQDGAIFVSIDDNEAKNLKSVLDEVFGEENFIAQMVWAAGRKNDSKLISSSHEYILVYARNIQALVESCGEWRTRKEGLDEIYAEYSRLRRAFSDDHAAVESGLKKWFRSLPEGDPSKRHKHYSCVDARGIYFPADLRKPSATSRSRYDILHPTTGKPVNMHPNGWQFAPEKMQVLLAEDRIRFGPDETTRPTFKTYLEDSEFEVPYSVFYVDGRGATRRLTDLLGGRVFENPKDERVLKRIIEFASGDGDLILDFFAGSGATAHAVALQNLEDGKDRRIVSVNFPERTDPQSEAFKAGFQTVSDITLARLKKVLEQVEGADSQGLRVLRLGESNFRRLTHEQGELELTESTLRDGPRNWDAIAAEVLLKEGVTLDQPWERLEVDGVQLIVSGGIAVPLTDRVSDQLVLTILEMKPRMVVFLEDGFAGADAVKANAMTNAKAAGVTMKTV